MPSPTKLLRSALICGLIASASLTPTISFAENVDVMVLNIRGNDGIYRPALRVIRGGSVVFIPAGTQGLTEAILYDRGALLDYLVANVIPSQAGDEVIFAITVIKADPPPAPTPTPPAPTPTPPAPTPTPPEEPTIKDCVAKFGSLDQCDKDETVTYCSHNFPEKFSTNLAPMTPEAFCFPG